MRNLSVDSKLKELITLEDIEYVQMLIRQHEAIERV